MDDESERGEANVFEFDGYSPSAQVAPFEMEHQHSTHHSNHDDNNDNRLSRRYECLSCWLYFALLFVISYATPLEVHKRPIPFQYLQSSGEYIRNQIYDQPIPQQETVSVTALVLICGLAPIVLQLLLSFALPVKERVLDRHRTLCVYLVGTATVTVATESIKRYCGVLRPIFYAVCQPDATYTTCTTTNAHELDDVHKSFPSGHSSLAFHGLLLLSLYLQYTWGRKDKASSRAISVLTLLPSALATWIAASRVQDNKHHPFDVIAGSVLGGTIAYFTHNLWFGSKLP